MKKILFFSILILSVIIITNLITSIYTLWHKQDLLVKAQQQLQQEKNEHLKLQQELTVVSKPSFVEEEARNKLFMTKAGEQEVLIAQATQNEEQKEVVVDRRPYWQQWLGLFFH